MPPRVVGETTDETRVTYEMLYELVRREKSREELQKLDDHYLAGVLAFLSEQDGRMVTIGATSEMFANSERDQLIAQQQNTRRLVRELYERRERKIVDLALNRSRTGSDLIDTSGLTHEEKALFDMLVTSMDAFRRGVLGNLLTLKAPERALVGMSAAAPSSVAPSLSMTPRTVEHTPTPVRDVRAHDPVFEAPKDGMRKVKFTQPVEQFVGQELELYGPFQAGDEAELPATVAEVLLLQKTAIEAVARTQP